MSSPAKLTDTQRAILFEASQRKDRCLVPPKTLKAAAAQKVATKLLKAGLVREIKAKTGMEAWRRDEETGPHSLKLTDAGLKAIAADERGSQSIPSTAVPQNNAKTAANMAAARSATAAPTATAPRQGTKIARVIELLQRDQGARLDRTALLAGVQFRQLELLDAVSVSGWGAGGFFQTIKDHAAVFQQLPGWATAALIESKIRTASHLELRPQPAA